MTIKKILVVEDNRDNRRILVYRLKRMGNYRILEAANGKEALNQLNQQWPDLIFMDLKMPILDGWETTKQIRKMPKGAALPIIALTAQAMVGDEEKALAVGCSDYIAKPIVDESVLSEKLREYLGE